MSNYRRIYVQGGVYFFTVVLENRKSDLLCRYINEFRQAYAETSSFYPFKTIAICVLPNHFHLIIQLTEIDKNYSKILNSIKYNFSKRLPEKYKNPNPSKLNKRENGIWQRRFWTHLIGSELDLEQHIHYVYFNPVKHGLVKRVIDWQYSSFHRDVKQGIYSSDWGNFVDDTSVNLYDD
ncbi:MAG: transposase [Neisseriaceae bacterium]|nr:transposase [Neisseriaceae bacterium]